MMRGTPWSMAILRMRKLSLRCRVLLLGKLTTRSIWPSLINLLTHKKTVSEITSEWIQTRITIYSVLCLSVCERIVHATDPIANHILCIWLSVAFSCLQSQCLLLNHLRFGTSFRKTSLNKPTVHYPLST